MSQRATQQKLYSTHGLGTVILNGACRCICNGYAGSPYKHIGDPAGENACRCSISSSLESASMPESCFFPSEMNKTSVKLLPYLKYIL